MHSPARPGRDHRCRTGACRAGLDRRARRHPRPSRRGARARAGRGPRDRRSHRGTVAPRAAVAGPDAAHSGIRMAARSRPFRSCRALRPGGRAQSDVSLQLFIADAHGIVRSSSRPAIIGTDVSNRDYFRHEASLPADDGKMFVGELTQGQVTRLWQINLVRRLDNPDGIVRRRDRCLVRHQFVHAVLSRGRSRHARPDRRGQHARRQSLDAWPALARRPR